MSLKVYSAVWAHTFNAGATTQNSWFKLVSSNRKVKIRSLTFDVEIFNDTTHRRIDANISDILRYVMQVGSPGQDIANPFTYVSGLKSNDPNTFFITRPCQLLFDSFFVNNDLNFNFTAYLEDMAANLMTHFSFLVETEEKYIY